MHFHRLTLADLLYNISHRFITKLVDSYPLQYHHYGEGTKGGGASKGYIDFDAMGNKL